MFKGLSVWKSILAVLFAVLFGSVVAVLLVVPASIYSYVVYGWVLTILWGWFVIPLFHLPALSIAQAIGLTILVGFLFKSVPVDKGEEDKRETAKKVIDIIVGLLGPFITLGIGWIVYTYFIVH